MILQRPPRILSQIGKYKLCKWSLITKLFPGLLSSFKIIFLDETPTAHLVMTMVDHRTSIFAFLVVEKVPMVELMDLGMILSMDSLFL